MLRISLKEPNEVYLPVNLTYSGVGIFHPAEKLCQLAYHI